MKNVVFDLFDTILDKVSFDYFDGLKLLYQKYYKNVTSFNEFKFVAQEFRNKYMMDRKKTNKEIPFINQMLWFEEKYPSIKLNNKEEIEWEFFKACRREKKANNIEVFLEYLKKWGFNIYILSNSIFSNVTLKKYLAEFDLLCYFDEVFSSADIIDRKPALKAFEYVVNNTNIDFKEPTFFIGNSIEKDIEPSSKWGFISILRNHLDEPYDGFSFLDYKDLLDHFEKNYLYINSIMDDLSTVDGPGNRAVVFFQGCLLHCPGCHNEASWNLKDSHIVKVNDLATKLKNKAIKKRITLSGGEPLLQPKGIAVLCDLLKEYDLCLYTGFIFEEVPQEIIKNLHYLKIGPYVKKLRNVAVPYIGSSNQEFINLKGE